MYNNLNLQEIKNTPLEIIEYYFNNGSLRKTAKEFNIHYQTLYRWVRDYKKNGEKIREKFIIGYKRPWNRFPYEIEQKIVLLKEKEPSLTVREAKKILEKEGLKISIKGVWNVWKRYGYAGFKKDKFCYEFTKYIPWSKEAIKKYNIAKFLYDSGKLKEASEILNSIPSLPENDLIPKIPYEYLNLKRKVEKMIYLFGDIPLKDYIKKIEKLYKEAEKKNLNYLLLRISIPKIVALQWQGKTNKVLKEIKKINKFIKNIKNPSLFSIKFSLSIIEGNAYAMCDIKRARKVAQFCSYLLKNKKIPSPYFALYLGVLYVNILEYNKAEYWILKGINKVDEETKNTHKEILCLIYLNKGEYKKAINFLKGAKIHKWGKSSLLLYKSTIWILKGEFQKALSIINFVSKLPKKESKYLIFQCLFKLAYIYSLLNKNKEAKIILKKLFPFVKKNKFLLYEKMIEPLIKKDNSESEFPFEKIVLFLKNKKYYRALNYAKKKGIIQHLYRYIAFFPESVNELIEKGKKIYLPKSILKFPVFNKKHPVYHIKFLGKLRIYKNKKYLNIKLSPKEASFLIHFALKADKPGKGIELDKIYENFWNKSSKPEKNLSTLLFKIKKKLKISSHLIEISKKENILKNKGIYFTTDYSEFEFRIIQAKAFLNLEEYKLAKKEFLRAFKIFRDKPFKNMYDNWSEDLRAKILNRYIEEKEKAQNFF